MNKRIVIYFYLLLLIVSTIGCENEVNQSVINEVEEKILEYVPYSELPANYSLMDSKADGCVVLEDSHLTSGEAVWFDFESKTQAGESAMVRIAKFYTLDPKRVSDEYYNENKDKYPHLYIHDLSYDGESYHLHYIEGEKRYDYEYPYLVKSTGKPRSVTATYNSYICYFLAKDPNITYEDIMQGLLSSQLDANVDAVIVYLSRFD